jgi:large subunit ribosomal protein L22
MESTTVIKNVRISPKKLRFILPEIKKLTPKESLSYLLYTPKKGAKILYGAVKSAINNAKNYLKINDEELKFKVIAINEGLKLKRYQPGGRGTVKPYKKRFSHIKITLTGNENKLIIGENKKEPKKDENEDKEKKFEKKEKLTVKSKKTTRK